MASGEFGELTLDELTRLDCIKKLKLKVNYYIIQRNLFFSCFCLCHCWVVAENTASSCRDLNGCCLCLCYLEQYISLRQYIDTNVTQ